MKVSDVLFATMQSGKTTIDELARNVGKVTPLASELGVTFEEVGAMFAVLTKKLGDGKTAEAGTQIKAMLAELGKEGTKAAMAFEKLAGVSFANFVKQGGSVGDALRMMADEAARNGTGLQNMFGSIEAGMGALAIAANNGNDLADALRNVANGAGGTEAGFAKMEQTASRQFAKLKSQTMETMLKIGEAFLPLLTDILPMFTGFLEMLPALFGGSASSAQAFAGVMDFLFNAIKIGIKILGSVVSGFGGFGDILVWCGKMIGGFVAVFVQMGKTTFEPVVAVIGGVIDAFKALGDILADPFDAASYEKAMLELLALTSDNQPSGFGDKFASTFKKNKSFLRYKRRICQKHERAKRPAGRPLERARRVCIFAAKRGSRSKGLERRPNNARGNAAAVMAISTDRF